MCLYLYLYLLSHRHVPHPHEVKDDKHMSHSATIGVLAHHENIEVMNQSDGGQEDNEDSEQKQSLTWRSWLAPLDSIKR